MSLNYETTTKENKMKTLNEKYLKLKLSKTQRAIKTLLDEVKFLKGTEKKNTEYILAGLCATELELIKSLTNNERAGL